MTKNSFNTRVKVNNRDLNFSIKNKKPKGYFVTTEGAVKRIKQEDGTTAPKTSNITSYQYSQDLDRLFANPSGMLKDAIQLSETLYATNRIYSQIIDYYSGMYYWRYKVIPRKIKKLEVETTMEDYEKHYSQMLEVVEGLTLEVTMPALLRTLFSKGRIFITTAKDMASKTISTIIMPNEYCRPTIQNQYGIREFDFDLSYFESLRLEEEQLDFFLDMYPSDFKLAYAQYIVDKKSTGNKKDKQTKWFHVPSNVSACISMNEQGFPTILSVFYDIIDYKNYKINELDRNFDLLNKIVSQEVDMEKTGLDLQEVEELHASIRDEVCDNPGTRLITSVGKLSILQLQEETAERNEVLINIYKSIYNNAGLNAAVFSGDSNEALKISVQKDLNYLWNFVEQIQNFYNVAINKLYNFGQFQTSINILPISPYNEADKLQYYRETAALGVGVLDLVVGSGTKQVDLDSTLELEEFLNLSTRLIPLQSSHTQSSTGREEQVKEVADIKEPVAVKVSKKDTSVEEDKES